MNAIKRYFMDAGIFSRVKWFLLDPVFFRRLHHGNLPKNAFTIRSRRQDQPTARAGSTCRKLEWQVRMTAKTQSDRIFDRLQADILARRITPGSKLRINDIAESSEVSLGAVREVSGKGFSPVNVAARLALGTFIRVKRGSAEIVSDNGSAAKASYGETVMVMSSSGPVRQVAGQVQKW